LGLRPFLTNWLIVGNELLLHSIYLVCTHQARRGPPLIARDGLQMPPTLLFWIAR
jgi:hypothetical protein